MSKILLTSLIIISVTGCDMGAYKATSQLEDFGLDPSSHVEMFNRIQAGDSKMVSLFIDARKINLNIHRKSDGKTALIIAAESNQLSIARLLIGAGADVQARDLLGKTILHHAVSHNREAIPFLEALLEGNLIPDPGVDIDAIDVDGNTASHLAVQNGFKKALEKLLQSKPDTSLKNADGKTPLDLAKADGLTEMKSLLVNTGAVTGCPNCEDLFGKIENGDIGAIQDFVEAGLPIDTKDADGNSVLAVAILASNRDQERNALELEASPFVKNSMGRTPLHIAVTSRDDAIYNWILSAVDTQVDEQDNRGYTALALSIQSGRLERSIGLLSKGASVTWTTNSGLNILHLAAEKGSADLLNEVLKKSRNAKIASNTGVTPLMLAAGSGNKTIIDLLTKAGASVHDIDDEGASALVYAARKGNVSAISALLSGGSDPNIATNNNHMTPLHYSVLSGNTSAVKVLLDKRADPNAKTTDGASAYGIAKEISNKSIANLLREYGGKP